MKQKKAQETSVHVREANPREHARSKSRIGNQNEEAEDKRVHMFEEKPL